MSRLILSRIKDMPEGGLTGPYVRALQEVTIQSRIDSLLEDMNSEPLPLIGHLEIGDKERPTGVFHASEIGLDNGRTLCGKYAMGCGRYLYYSYTDAQANRSFSPELRRIFDTGSAIHLQLQLYLEECAHREKGASFLPEVAADPKGNKYGISCHIDGLWELSIPDLILRFGIELKSINESGYKVTTRIHDNHATQVTVYQAILDLPVFLVCYYNKNDSHICEFVQVFDPLRWSAIKRKLKYVKKHIKIGKPPAHEVSYKCTSCKFKLVCKPPKKMSAGDARRMFQVKTTVSGV